MVALRRSAPSAPSACRRRIFLSPSVVACHSLPPLSFPSDCSYALGRLRLTGYCFLVLRHWFCSIVCYPCTPLPRLPSVWGLHPGGFFVRHPLGAHYPFAISSFCTSCTSPALALVLPARPPRPAAVELCLALPAAALGLVLLLLRPPLAYVSSARTPSFCAFGPPVPSLSFG